MMNRVEIRSRAFSSDYLCIGYDNFRCLYKEVVDITKDYGSVRITCLLNTFEGLLISVGVERDQSNFLAYNIRNLFHYRFSKEKVDGVWLIDSGDLLNCILETLVLDNAPYEPKYSKHTIDTVRKWVYHVMDGIIKVNLRNIHE